jgi:hypothetical protein
LLPLLLKTLPAENRPSLCRLEGNRGFLAALGTSGPGFGLSGGLPRDRRAQNSNALCLAGLASFGFVLELLIVKKQLFACGKDEVRSAVDTFEYLVLEIHPSPQSPVAAHTFRKELHVRVRTELLRTPPQTTTLGFGPPAGHAGLLRK